MVEEIASTTDLFEIIRTTRSMRRLKPDPVPNELNHKILEAGVCAPSGGNMQHWRFLVVRDPKVKETVGALGAAMKHGAQHHAVGTGRSRRDGACSRSRPRKQ
jgi:nitroreductase